MAAKKKAENLGAALACGGKAEKIKEVVAELIVVPPQPAKAFGFEGFAPAPVPGMQMLAIAGILAPILWL